MKNTLKASTYAVCTALACVSALLVLIACNHIAERIWFKNNVKHGHFFESESHTLYKGKARYLAQPNLPYNAFIFGGSKAGALQPATLAEKTGLSFYNYWNSSGTFEDYERYLHFVTAAYPVDTIILHLSSLEVEQEKSLYEIPIEMQRALKAHQSIVRTIKNILVSTRRYMNLEFFLIAFSARKSNILTHSDGSRNFELKKQLQRENPGDYIQKNVLNSWGKYNECMSTLFSEEEPQTLIACKENIAALKRIQSYCTQEHIQLVVILGPTFVSELYKYATPTYIQYVKDMVSVCNVWNFSGIHDVNLNPYNFADGGHYFDFVGNVIIDTVFSQQEANTSDMDAFGIVLSPDNVDAFIARQKEKWHILKAEYDATGTISLQTQDSASYLGKHY